MQRVFKTRHFMRWARKAGLPDDALCNAVHEIAHGLVDADLGGGVLKKRVALPGRGKRGSTRTLLATNRDTRWFFVFGFEKNAQDNVTPEELKAVHALADDLLALSPQALDDATQTGALTEICREP